MQNVIIRQGYFFLVALCLVTSPVCAEPTADPAILVVGASFEEATLPLDDNFQGVLGGMAINLGSYMSLGNALTRTPLLNGFVINEAQAGAGTFDRLTCNPGPGCGPAGWRSYYKQFARALTRVAIRNPANPAEILGYNADYVVIGGANDCLHSDAFGIPQDQTSQCSTSELNAVADRLIAVGQQALNAGITPIYYKMPDFADLDLPLAASLFGLQWMLDEEHEYNEWRDTIWNRLTNGLTGALFVEDAMSNFTHGGDGLHPSTQSVEKAAVKIALAIVIDRLTKQ